jgi:6-phospho-beta-glucosidase
VKLTIIGGGGFRVPQIYEALASEDSHVPINKLCLYDVSPKRMEKVAAVIDELSQLATKKIEVEYSTNLDQCLTDASYVFSAMRVGGLESRVLDEKIALDLDVLGQETVGAGGLAYSLRTLPHARNLARKVKEICPNAWVINFTNPAGLITEAMQAVMGERVVGICDTPIGLMKRVSKALVSEGQDFNFDYVGLNHLGWLRSMEVEGEDLLPKLLEDDQLLNSIEEARIMGPEWVRSIGAIPNEYLYYYYYARESFQSIKKSQETRGQYLSRSQQEFYAEDSNASFDNWSKIMHARESSYMKESRSGSDRESRLSEDAEDGGYQKVALDLIAGLSGGESGRMILNVPNKTADGQRLVPELNDQAVVEVPCTVTTEGVQPRKVAPVAGDMLGLMAQVKSSEQLILKATEEGSLDLAWRAFATHPLVDSVNIGKELLINYTKQLPGTAETFNTKSL